LYTPHVSACARSCAQLSLGVIASSSPFFAVTLRPRTKTATQRRSGVARRSEWRAHVRSTQKATSRYKREQLRESFGARTH